MLTTKTILTRTSKELGIPYEVVEANYKAWVKGLKDRINDNPVLYIYLPNSIQLFFNTKISNSTYGRNRSYKPIRDSVKKKRELVKRVVERMREANPHLTNASVNRQVIYNHTPPLEFYGLEKGYTLSELESIQDRMFEMKNKHEYKRNYKI